MNQRSNPAAAAPSMRGLRLALLFAVLFVLAGFVLFYIGTRHAQLNRASEDRVVSVEVGAHACTPENLTVPAGKTVFRIQNTSDRAVEWEILDGVMVVEERENIVPGFTQTLTANLAPGDYAITCGLLSNPRGRLHVTPTEASQASMAAAPSLADFVGPLSEYRVYLGTQSAALAQAARKLADAIEAADSTQARAAYLAAHQAYARVGPVAGLFADLDHRLDASAAYFDQRESDPAFSGFRRIEYGLYAQGQLQSLVPVARALVADVDTLSGRIDELSLKPAQLATLGARRLEQMASALDVKPEPYAQDGVAQAAATLDGVHEIYRLLQPLLKNQAALEKSVADGFAAAAGTLQPLRDASGYPDDARVAPAVRATLAKQLHALSADLGRINPALGL
ncbi:cupredoxin domain-containing protein [Candidimonas humi]|uniref:Iron uptake system protein EfeO n=1 Tax=Candidimonas humi TaxID=683355 RepID=A0ABV8P3E4_9BURK|nr:iron uptake system protein EfeO [Candidimonas humi]MBV6305404.1 cupredoxin domain-containing protein [Candidimonas humi]